MKNIDSYTHVRGESVYLDDIPLVNGTLYAAAFDSPVAHGRIKSLDYSEAEAMPGVVRIFTAKDIPGENQIGGIIPDEDMKQLNEMGVGKLFPPGTHTDDIVSYIREWVKQYRNF